MRVGGQGQRGALSLLYLQDKHSLWHKTKAEYVFVVWNYILTELLSRMNILLIKIQLIIHLKRKEKRGGVPTLIPFIIKTG